MLRRSCSVHANAGEDPVYLNGIKAGQLRGNMRRK